MLPLETIRRYAQAQGWEEVQFNIVSKVIGFARDDQRVNVYWTTGTVGTCVNHPRKGKTQLFRRNQTLQDLHRIFQNPRIHTGTGYYKRSSWRSREPSAEPSGGLWCCLADSQYQKALLGGFNRKTVQLALGEGYFAVQADGSSWWWGIPTSLYNKMKGRQSGQPDRAGVSCIALGPNDAYYVQFEDGTGWCGGSDSLAAELHSRSGVVDLLALAPGGGWFVQYEDGSNNWEGIPRGLHNQINGRMTSLGCNAAAATIEDLAIGPSGEWWVRYADGDWRSGGISDSCSRTMDKLMRQGEDIASVRFGDRHSWVIVY